MKCDAYYLYVSYGDNKSTVLKYRGQSGIFSESKWNWCEQTFLQDTWRYHDGYVYFEKEEDLTMYLLKWS